MQENGTIAGVSYREMRNEAAGWCSARVQGASIAVFENHKAMALGALIDPYLDLLHDASIGAKWRRVGDDRNVPGLVGGSCSFVTAAS